MRRIIFVDDESRILEGLQNLLRRHRSKWEMVFACGGEAALSELEGSSFDVIVSDMRMPGIDGAALLRRVQQRWPHMVRIVLSGYAELEAALRAVPVAHQFLSKPTDAATLENVVERACSLRSLIDDEAVRALVGKLDRLPAAPRIHAELTRVLADEKTSAREIAAVLERDPSMCAKLLQLVNGAFFGLGRRITRVEAAVSYLGVAMIRNLALTLELFGDYQQPVARGFSPDRLQRHSLEVAAVASRMLKGDRQRADDAFAAGMLHDIGKLLLALQLPDEAEKALLRARESRRPVHEVEQELHGVTHAELGAYLLGLWGLPWSIVEAVANHHAPERVPQREFDALAAVHLADALVHQLGMGPPETGPAREVSPEYLASLGVADRWPAWVEAAEDQRAATGSSPGLFAPGERINGGPA